MNNEPVAWMLLRDESCVETTEWYGVMRGWEKFLGDNEKIVELYTHTTKTLEPDCYGDGNVYRGVRSKDSAIQTIHIDSTAKTLTDEEIVEIYNDILIHDKKSSIKFAKAILRKAQEK